MKNLDRTALLMSETNPNGYPLETLMGIVVEDLEIKSQYILTKKDEERWGWIIERNDKIIELLKSAAAIQKETMEMIEAKKATS
jgi:hypothetical protein